MLNIEECRSFLSEAVSATLSDEALASLRDQIQTLSEVCIDYALKIKLS